MDIISAVLLILSVCLSSTRNVLTKGFSGFSIKNRQFFRIQALIFGTGTIVLLAVLPFNYNGFSLFTVGYALIYGSMLLCAQWFYTIALTNGKTALCATIYSFGFIIPTLSGTIFWSEKISVFGYIGILTVIPILIISSSKKGSDGQKATKKFILPVIIAMLCSGGLGIIQKIQQGSEYANQTSSFILVAFLLSLTASLLFSIFTKNGEKQLSKRSCTSAMCVGIAFSICNLLNTTLAGRLDSALFFPVLNVGIIMLSVLMSVLIYKEKVDKKDIWVLILGAMAIILVNL